MVQRYVVRLSEEERAELQTLIGRGTAPARKLMHARILFKANRGEAGSGWTDAAIAGALEVGQATVGRVRQAYCTSGLAAALERKAPERVYHRKLDGKQEAHLVALTCGSPPAGQQRWTLRLLAEQLVALEVVDTVSYETVRQVLKKTRAANLTGGAGTRG